MDINNIENIKENQMLDIENQEESKIHIRLVKGRRRGKDTYVTSVEGLAKDLDLKRITKVWKKLYNCPAFIRQDRLGNDVIQLFGDNSIKIKQWLIFQKIIIDPENIVIHN